MMLKSCLAVALVLLAQQQVNVPDWNQIVNYVIAVATGGAATTVPGFVKWAKGLKKQIVAVVEMSETMTVQNEKMSQENNDIKQTISKLEGTVRTLVARLHQLEAQVARSGGK